MSFWIRHSTFVFPILTTGVTHPLLLYCTISSLSMLNKSYCVVCIKEICSCEFGTTWGWVIGVTCSFKTAQYQMKSPCSSTHRGNHTERTGGGPGFLVKSGLWICGSGRGEGSGPHMNEKTNACRSWSMNVWESIRTPWAGGLSVYPKMTNLSSFYDFRTSACKSQEQTGHIHTHERTKKHTLTELTGEALASGVMINYSTVGLELVIWMETSLRVCELLPVATRI